MAERPIIFNSEMVRAILDGRKTQTRRVITRKNSYYDGGPWPKKDFAFIRGGHDEERWDAAFVDSGPSPAGNPGPYLHLPIDHFDTMMQKHDRTVHRIYSRIWTGDLLWVKETWARGDLFTEPDSDCICYRADGQIRPIYGPSWGDKPSIGSPLEFINKLNTKWKSPIFMPKWACRLWPKVNDVRVERVQDISEEDAQEEGCKNNVAIEYQYPNGEPIDYTGRYARERFEDLWDSINIKRPGCSWGDNPWCWKISFEVINNKNA